MLKHKMAVIDLKLILYYGHPTVKIQRSDLCIQEKLFFLK